MEELELAMKVDASPIGDGATGMIRIQSRLANLTIQLQDMKRGKEAHEDIWCTRCQTDGHTKYEILTYMNYISSSGSNTLNNQGLP